MYDVALFAKLVRIVQEFNDDPDEINKEYVRGQAELICEAVGLPLDGNIHWITNAITAESE